MLYEHLMYILAGYVDDSNLVDNLGKFIMNFKVELSERIEIEDLDPSTWLLGYKIEQDIYRKEDPSPQSRQIHLRNHRGIRYDLVHTRSDAYGSHASRQRERR